MPFVFCTEVITDILYCGANVGSIDRHSKL